MKNYRSMQIKYPPQFSSEHLPFSQGSMAKVNGKTYSEMALKEVCEFGLWFKQEPVDIIMKMAQYMIPWRCFGIVGAYALGHGALQYLGDEIQKIRQYTGDNAGFGFPH